MPKAKPLTAACLALFALSVPASANAGWVVSGKVLTAGESKPLATHALVLTTGSLRILSTGISIECRAHEVLLEGGKIVGTDGILVKSLTFKECATAEPLCELANGEIKPVPLHGKAQLDGSLNTYITLLPETKTVFATIKFNGEECPLLGIQAVAGTASVLVHEAVHEKAVHRGLVFTLPKALKIGTDEVHLSGISLDLALEKNEPWSFV